MRSNRIILAAAAWWALVPVAVGQGVTDPAAPPSRQEVEAKVTDLLDAFDLTPRAAAEIPNDPPPHEGAMIDQPEYRIEPPDMILVEVLEALPGRPISGERLVRADGTVSLGFYGDVHVRGLTLRQAKVKIIKHLRGVLSDEALGLHEEATPPRDEPASSPAPPDQSNRVFVMVTAYNSKNYHVSGDVAAPGKLPITGNETVLDALEYAGGLLPTANPRDIRLVRPGRDGKPGKVYPVDLEAIRDRGETSTNYQMFAGDRLVVGRDEVVEKTVQIDRLAAAIHAVATTIERQAKMSKTMDEAYPSLAGVELEKAVEFWVREMNRPGGVVLDENTLRDALLRRLQAKPKEPKDEE